MPASAKGKTATRKSTAKNTKRNSSNKNTTTRKSSAGRASSNRRKRNTKKEESFLKSEIITLVTLAISVVLLLSCFGVGGYVGKYVADVLFGIFGALAYVFPLVLFVGTAFHMSNRGNPAAALKLAAGILAFILVDSLIQLLAADKAAAGMIGYYAYGAARHISGGWLGGVITGALYPALGMAGQLIVTLILLIICAVVITERSFVGQVQKSGRKVADRAREDAERRREHAQMVREERERERALRMDHKVTGVAMEDIQLEPRPESADVHEVGRFGRKKKDVQTQEQPLQAREPEENASTAEADVSRAAQKQDTREEDSASDFPRGKDAFTITGIRMKEEPEEAPVHAAFGGLTGEMQERVAPDIPARAGSGSQRDAGSVAMPTDGAETDVYGEDAFDAGRGESEPARREPARHTPASGSKVGAADDGKPVTAEDIDQEIQQKEETDPLKEYHFPPLDLLKKGKATGGNTEEQLRETAAKLRDTLHNFGVNVTITNVSCGPAVTRYELQPEQGVKVSKIVGLSDDIKLNLAAADIRIEAPIPGKAAVGIEVPNKTNSAVMLRDLLESKEFQNHPSRIAFAAGKDIAGQVVVTDIAKMPHLLIAGATGSGKSVCINTIIMSILYKAKPDEVKLIMIDPKVVELSVYNGIPHLYIPVVTDPKKAAGALNWAVAEMMDRYQKFAESGVRDLKGYNEKVEGLKDIESDTKPTKLPEIVIIVDELADLMMVAPGEVEDAICRLAQLARAAGIHLIIATQRPSVNVITGLIKANMPSRIAFSVSSGVDSRTILDMNGAEKLLGKGDMLFYPQGYQKPARVQGAFVSDEEVAAVVNFLARQQSAVSYNQAIEERMNAVQDAGAGQATGGSGPERDAYFVEAGKFIIEKDKASIGMLQRWFKIGFNRAARIMDQLAEAGVVGEEEGTKPRKVLMSMEEFEQYVDEYV